MSGHSYGGGSQDRNRIDITEERECHFWAERLGVRPTELEAAVGAVGNEVNDVWLYVDRLKHEPDPAPAQSLRATDDDQFR